MNNPAVSIIMPAYGVESFISKAIDSVLAQSFEDWELLVVNDGSKDNTRQVAKEYEAKDNRILVLDKENGGLSDARNFGLSFAKGRYVHFFDSDDTIEPDFYERLFSVINDTDYDFVVCGYYIDVESIESQAIVSSKRHSLFDDISPLQANFDLHTLGEYFNFAWNKLYRRDFLTCSKLHFQKGLYGYEDVEFMSKVLKYNPKFRFISYLGYHYICRDRETLSNIYDESVLANAVGNLICYKEILSFFAKNKRSQKEFQRAVLGMYKSLFPFVYKRYGGSQYSAISNVVSYKPLRGILSYSAINSMTDLVFYLLILLHCSFLIFCFYKFRLK